ncbi:MAG TPA: metalloregulator ArsR/SmtB family transcription factor [Saprospiraceae bacterium]|nr:metalloregulator ArsR/SmtB family transcription factor [Saprospiraceae bacterium]HMP25820.1 metalloregulator ArsR/SmtB family transcription factor [Saprospiraceae bacterium]
MAINKSAEFSEELIQLAEFAKALAHPARIAILQTLAEKQMCICGEIVEVLPLAQATVSQHLKELKNAGLITGEIEGKKSCYCINWDALERFTGKMNTMFKNLSQQQCC